MKNKIKLLSILIITMTAAPSFAGSFSSNNIGGTVYDPTSRSQCSYEIYCNKTTGRSGIDPNHVILDEFGGAISPNGWSGYEFSNKKY